MQSRLPGLHCAPPDLATAETNEAQASERSRETQKWLYGAHHKDLPIELRNRFVDSFAAAFQKQYAMDFYITKYQGKQMEALTPLFQSMTGGVHRLEEQEREEEQQAQATGAGDEEPVAKKRRIHEHLAKRARRLTIRLASMPNRCYLLSTSASSPGSCNGHAKTASAN